MTSEAFTKIDAGSTPIIIVADHASSFVPPDIDLGIDPDLLTTHIAVDIGVAQVARLLAKQLSCVAILGGVSRLVIDLNREPDAPGLLPLTSDGVEIVGNRTADLADRLTRFYEPYHAVVEQTIDTCPSPFILSLHSFTPRLVSDPMQARPWDIGILYNDDDRAARIAIPLLEQAGLHVGDQLPYSGKRLNATMNRHAESSGIPYLGVEMRQNLVNTPAGQQRSGEILGQIVLQCRNSLAREVHV